MPVSSHPGTTGHPRKRVHAVAAGAACSRTCPHTFSSRPLSWLANAGLPLHLACMPRHSRRTSPPDHHIPLLRGGMPPRSTVRCMTARQYIGHGRCCLQGYGGRCGALRVLRRPLLAGRAGARGAVLLECSGQAAAIADVKPGVQRMSMRYRILQATRVLQQRCSQDGPPYAQLLPFSDTRR